MPEERRTWLGIPPVLWGIVLLAAILRLYALNFGFPHTQATPDEIQLARRSLRFFTGDLNPHFYEYPTLYLYLVAAVYGAAALFQSLLGADFATILLDEAVRPISVVFSARMVSALAGTATPVVVYFAAKTLSGRRAGLAAALFMAVSVVHVRDSHFGRSDALLTLFIALAGLFVLRAHDYGTRREYIWTGVFAGLAASTKYVGLVFGGPVVALHWWAFVRGAREWRLEDGSAPSIVRSLVVMTWRSVLDARLWLFGLAAVSAFVMFTPFSILDFEIFSNHFLSQMGHLKGGHGLDLGVGGWYHLRYTLPLGLGWPVFLGGIAGAGIAFRQNWERSAVFFMFPVLFYLLTADSRTVFLRYMLPLFPFVSVAAGIFTAFLIDRLPDARRVVLGGLLVGLFAAPSLYAAVQFDRMLARTDSRVLAGRWLQENARAGENTVHQTGVVYGRLELPETADSLRARRDRVVRQASWGSGALEKAWSYSIRSLDAKIDWLEAQGSEARFTAVTFDEDTGSFGDGDPPDYVVVLESPLRLYSPVFAALREILQDEYRLVESVRGVGGLDAPGWYDQHDAFYLPLIGFGGVVRPGPDITIYQRMSEPEDTAR
ncbi:MAG: ArnT family glycosyltransferase [Longimicrobiales bacterium]